MSASPRPVSSAASTAISPAPVPPVPARVVTVATVAAALAIVVLIVPEIWLVAGGLAWALGTMLHLPAPAFAALATVLVVPAIWATWRVWVMAFEAETDPENVATMRRDRPRVTQMDWDTE